MRAGPCLSSRIASRQSQRLTGVWPLGHPTGSCRCLKRLYYDTAGSANPMSFGALMQLVTPGSVLLGTDFPFIPEPGIKATIAGLRQVGLDEAAVRAIEGEKAGALFPRFGG